MKMDSTLGRIWREIENDQDMADLLSYANEDRWKKQ